MIFCRLGILSLGTQSVPTPSLWHVFKHSYTLNFYLFTSNVSINITRFRYWCSTHSKYFDFSAVTSQLFLSIGQLKGTNKQVYLSRPAIWNFHITLSFNFSKTRRNWIKKLEVNKALFTRLNTMIMTAGDNQFTFLLAISLCLRCLSNKPREGNPTSAVWNIHLKLVTRENIILLQGD